MTMIVGINLDKYIIVAADRREVSIVNGEVASIRSDEVNKFVQWNGGIITGCGYVPLLSYLKESLKSTDIANTNQIVSLTKKVLADNPHIAKEWKSQTNWMFNYLTAGDKRNECRLGFISSDSPDEVRMLYPYHSTIWAKLPDLENRILNLNKSLMPLKEGDDFSENFEYHLRLISELFEYGASVDMTVCNEFDFYLQHCNGEDYFSWQEA
ncbi:hypothetical protein ACD631_02560 [Alteromonas macleodii]|uniref:hypothetical protein n=1 Tax=Alteromonas macleodii TaxID=28108 RepID=UPI0020768B20|nr:hypothetical protein [Alteromonas macleodii]USI29244.1 hypothetical protein NFG60_06010 [Alteromonas macleodii]